MGRMAAQVVGAATDRGVYAYFKHFATNDQEKNRESGISFVNEQALREIYLKSFQMVFEEGKSMGVMGSYNRLGLMETAASYQLLTEVLRDEWGFKGHIISDMTHSGNGSINFNCYENVNWRVLAGCNQQLDSGGFNGLIEAEWDSSKKCPVFTNNGQKVEAYSWWYALRTNAQRVIWMQARCGYNSRQFINPANDVELTNVIRGVYEGEVGKEVEIEIKLPSELNGYEMEIDPFTALPEGLSFDGNKITGSSDAPINKFIHVILTNGNEKLGITFELRIFDKEAEVVIEDIPADVTPDEGGDKGDNKPAAKGCFGAVEATLLATSLVGILALSFLLIDKKRKIAE
jgi:hypothetical protein